jgi:hypothetical protein
VARAAANEVADGWHPTPKTPPDPHEIKYVLCEYLLPRAVLTLYTAKLGVFYEWHPMALSAGGNIGVTKRPGGRYEAVTDAEYAAWRASKPPPQTVMLTFDAVDMRTEGYLYNRDARMKPDAALDDVDRRFLACKATDSVQKLELYGLHSYSGYYGNFQPDLEEVINLVSARVPVAALPSVERIYVTTEAHPTDNYHDAYDVRADRHRAKTTAYILLPPLAPAPAAWPPAAVPPPGQAAAAAAVL